jgi:hypothetical protein
MKLRTTSNYRSFVIAPVGCFAVQTRKSEEKEGKRWPRYEIIDASGHDVPRSRQTPTLVKTRLDALPRPRFYLPTSSTRLTTLFNMCRAGGCGFYLTPHGIVFGDDNGRGGGGGGGEFLWDPTWNEALRYRAALWRRARWYVCLLLLMHARQVTPRTRYRRSASSSTFSYAPTPPSGRSRRRSSTFTSFKRF